MYRPPPAIETGAFVTVGGALLQRAADHFVGRFEAMASPCSVLVETEDRELAAACTDLAMGEARRVERKFSRYRKDNIVARINGAAGRPVRVDPETAGLLAYAETCFEASGGRFDITSGVLRRAWRFDGGSAVPSRRAVDACRKLIGWQRASWDGETLRMPPEMEIDLGGIGKEYAVDRAAALIAPRVPGAAVVNFGGDLFSLGARRGGKSWGVGVEDPEQPGEGMLYRLDVARAGLATSGDARRFVRWRGRRLGHILDPTTGWPVEGGPSSVTVLAATCLEAGTLATLACLRGAGARQFLEEQGAQYWLAESPADLPRPRDAARSEP